MDSPEASRDYRENSKEAQKDPPRFNAVNYQAVGGTGLQLGESDCGKGPPTRPKKNPCDPPKGPCRPSDPPGYPSSKPRHKRKPFCVKCPPKKPCKDDHC